MCSLTYEERQNRKRIKQKCPTPLFVVMRERTKRLQRYFAFPLSVMNDNRKVVSDAGTRTVSSTVWATKKDGAERRCLNI